mmetsp:Transcript_30104/g.69453  ORF Transcript_30104/g.69453 Transcript_30104/m.69453 type:complete len:171 (-) Transcript_30104:850-1362(-)
MPKKSVSGESSAGGDVLVKVYHKRQLERHQEEEQLQRVRDNRRRWEDSMRQETDRMLEEEEERARGGDRNSRSRRKLPNFSSILPKRLVGKQGNAEAIGGKGDLRMCKVCKAGPIENQACPDLGTHNNTSTYYRKQNVSANLNPNHCPNCGWFDPNWNQWPYWDGVYGPH